MRKLTIGLFGMYGLYNYGCEAIVRGTYELIRKAWQNCDVILYTHRPSEDAEIVKDLQIIVKEIPMKNNLLMRRVINKSLRSIKINKQLTSWDSESVVNECDIVFSVGGDIYTIPKYILESKSERKYSAIVEFGKAVVKKKPMIIWGASIGPFGEKREVKEYYFNHLKDINQIFCREERTYNYLKSNGVNKNIQLCSDPAFYIESNRQSRRLEKESIKIALNLSPLSIKEQVGKNYESFEKDVINTIIDLLNIKNTEITLVPHVISPMSVDDNDLVYMQNIYKKIPGEHKNRVKILENAKGFLDTKYFLKNCNLVIAARMHCAVNAICEGVPTIFLTYSQKGVGMTNHIYGDTYWSIPLLNINTELKNKTIEILSKQDKVSVNIKNRIDEIKNEESRIIDLFRKQI